MIQLMNIRKIKKKKVITFVPDKERSATDRLFEISWMCEQKEEDESTVLIDQGKIPEEKTLIIRQTMMKNCSNSRTARKQIKSNSIDKYRENRQFGYDEQVSADISLGTSFSIFNAIMSNRVFVGTLKNISSSRQHKNCRRHQHIASPKRRADTMPMINLHWPCQRHKAQGDEEPKTAVFRLARINFKQKDKSLSLEKKKSKYS